jgi:hypothetical protein
MPCANAAVLDPLGLPTGVRMNPSYIHWRRVVRDARAEFSRLGNSCIFLEIDEHEAVLAGQRGLPQPHHRRGDDPPR